MSIRIAAASFVLASMTVAALAAASASVQDETSPVRVRVETTMGEFVLELNREKAPITCANFLEYVDEGHYNGTIFHRVMSGFMIQGGGFTVQMEQKRTKASIKNEWQNGLSNERGTIAMARTNDPDSATSQFFVNVVNNPRLDGSATSPGYAVFGKVVEGMDVVDKIRNVDIRNLGRMQNVPVEPIVMTKVERVEDE